MNYQQQANDFASKYNLKLKILGSTFGKHFTDDKENRMIYKCRLSRGGKSYTFNFGASIADPSQPDMYDILATVEKYPVDDFEDFCANYGYDTDSRQAEKTFKACKKEYEAMLRVCGKTILDEMQEIQ